MPKIKAPKSSPMLDMTPMVDLAFLLVTFFMLTATARVTEPVIVDTPSSVSDLILPNNVMLITIDKGGKVFYNINNAEVRKKTLEKMGAQYKITFSENEKKRFAGMTSFGVPMSNLKQYIALSDDQRASVKSPGIPTDSLDNQLHFWIQYGMIEAKRLLKAQQDRVKESGGASRVEDLRYAIKADSKTNFIRFKEVIDIFKDLNIYRFSMITNLEQEAVAETGSSG